MAKFKQNNVELRDNQKLIFDSAKNKYISYDGIEVYINTTISGVEPTDDSHLTTRNYVDVAITTATGSLSSVQYIDDLLDVTSNNPLDNQVLTYSGSQWIPTTQVSFTGGSMGEWEYKGVSADVDPGSKKFKVDDADAGLITEIYVSDINRADIDLGNFLGNFVAGDQLYLQKTNVSAQAYLYTVVSVVDNTSYHTFTVTYDDDTGIDLNDKDKITFVKLSKNVSVITDHGLLTGLGDDDHTQYTLVSGTRAFTGTVGGVTPTQDSHLATKGYVDSFAPIFGSEYDYASSEGESSTTNTSPQEKVSLSLTSVPAGKYRIDYSFEGSSDDDKNSVFAARVQIDDTTTICETGTGAAKGLEDYYLPFTGFYEATLSGSHDIDIDYWDDVGTAGVNIRRARISVFRIS